MGLSTETDFVLFGVASLLALITLGFLLNPEKREKDMKRVRNLELPMVFLIAFMAWVGFSGVIGEWTNPGEVSFLYWGWLTLYAFMSALAIWCLGVMAVAWVQRLRGRGPGDGNSG